MAHFAITDVSGRRFVATQRLAREALGLAGATAPPLRVWVEDWSAAGDADARRSALALRASDSGSPCRSSSQGRSRPRLQGDRGSTPRGRRRATRRTTTRSRGSRRAARSRSTATRARSPAWFGWTGSGARAAQRRSGGVDWFALHLVRRARPDVLSAAARGRHGESVSGGSLVERDGTITGSGPRTSRRRRPRHWMSERRDTRYPIAWRISIPTQGLPCR